MREPAVSVPQVNTALDNFYKYGNDWAYTLQLAISAAQMLNFQELKYEDYDYLLSDMPFSSYIYGKIHLQNGVLNQEEFDGITKCYKPFPFDYLIVLKASKEETKRHVRKRNLEAKEGKIQEQLDLAIDDLSYLDTHIDTFGSFIDDYIKEYFPVSNIIIKEIPDMLTPEYAEMLKDIVNIIEGN